MEARLVAVLKLETETAGARSAALAGAPIEVRSALSRTASATVSPTLGGRRVEMPVAAEAPDWPPPDVEAAMSAEVAERDGSGGRSAPQSRRAREMAETLDGGPLPALAEIMGLVPASVQEQLDDLFRAKFQAVRRIPEAVLKINQDQSSKQSDSDESDAELSEDDDTDD